jgi:hypothetical protein
MPTTFGVFQHKFQHIFLVLEIPRKRTSKICVDFDVVAHKKTKIISLSGDDIPRDPELPVRLIKL